MRRKTTLPRAVRSNIGKPTTKQIGDAGEYFLLAELSFAGHRVVKLPHNWPVYDLFVETNVGRPQRVAVECRDQYPNAAPALIKHANGDWDWFGCVIRFRGGPTRWWLLPEHEFIRLSALEASTGRRRLNISTLLGEAGAPWESYVAIHAVD